MENTHAAVISTSTTTASIWRANRTLVENHRSVGMLVSERSVVQLGGSRVRVTLSGTHKPSRL